MNAVLCRKLIWMLWILCLGTSSVYALSRPLTLGVSQEEPQHGGSLVIGIAKDPGILNTALMSEIPNLEICVTTFQASLVGHDDKFQPIPKMAESWEMSPDGKVYTFHLVQNATWSDGVEFTSADVKFSFDEMIIPKHHAGQVRFGSKLSDEGITTPDNYTVVFHFKDPYPPSIFLGWLDASTAGLNPKHIYEGTDVISNPHNMAPTVAVGPFVFKEWVKGDHLTFVRNPLYFREGLPYLDEIIFKIVPDESVRVIALERGEIDFLAGDVTPYWGVERLQRAPGVVVMDPPFAPATAVITALRCNVLNHTNSFPDGGPVSPLSNVDVRKALLYAIDRQQISDLAFYGLNPPTYSAMPVTPSTDWCRYDPPLELMYKFNVTKANYILDQIYPEKDSDGIRLIDGDKRFTLDFATSTSSTYMKVSEIISGQLANVGVEAVLRHLDFATMVEHVFVMQPPNFDFWMNDNWWTGFDPMNLYNHLSSERIGPIPWGNNMGWIDPSGQFDDLLNEGGAELNTTRRGEFYKEAQKILLENLPLFPLVRQLQFPVWTLNVQNIAETWGTQDGEWLDKVWIETALDYSENIALLENRLDLMTNVAYVALVISVVALVVAGFLAYRASKLRK